MKCLFYAISCFAFFVGCTTKPAPSKAIIAQDTMRSFIKEWLIFQYKVQMQYRDTTLRDSVLRMGWHVLLKKHGITPERLQTTFNAYIEDPSQWQGLSDSLLQSLQRYMVKRFRGVQQAP